MKRILYLTTMVVALLFVGCAQEFDDSEIWDKLDNHESRITALEELCRQMNTNISSLQTIVTALQNNDYVTGVAPITKNGETIGYAITFTKSQPITIYHGENGKDGQNGTNGTNGADGKDGSTPVIGVKIDDDGIYYWTLNGEWLTDENGNKIKAVGTDGKDGQDGADGKDGENGADGKDGQDGADGKDGEDGKDGQNGTNGTDGKDGQNGTNGADGKDGITPQLKIEEGYWFISYDNGATWTQLGKATGEDGKDGANGQDGTNGTNGTNGVDGDSFFQSVTQDENNVYIVLADGTEITIPKKINLDDVKLTYIPRYDDGKATVLYSYKSDSYVELDFEVSPASKAADWSDITTVKAVYTESRAGVEFVEMDILSWTTDAPNGTISIKASGRNLSDDFFDGNQSASVRIAIENDDKNIISDYIPMIAERLPMPESNEIWYTATEKVTPYASNVFGANIVSNVWDESTGKGVITFDGDVTSIGNKAFAFCSNLTSITIPESVTSIGNGVFMDCERLSEFKSSYASADGRCLIINGILKSFASAGLTDYNIPKGITSIGDYAFYGSNLANIAIPDGVSSIGGWAFAWCRNLRTIIIPEGVTTIGEWAFYYCWLLTSITLPETLTTIGARVFENCYYGFQTIIIPENVTSIGYGAFWGCENLKRVFCKPITPPALSDSGIFDSSASDYRIFVPLGFGDTYKNALYWSNYSSNIIETNADVHMKYTATTKIKINNFNAFGVNVISNEWNPTTRQGTITFDANITTIGNSAFSGCSGLTSITIPESVTSIGDSAFQGCSSLTSITIPESVTSIGNSAFFNCSSLTSITIPEGVISIGGSAFSGCSSLTSITIPESVASIGENPFVSCANLKEFNGKFASNNGRCLIVDGVLNSFAPAGLTEYTIPKSVTSMGDYAFCNCSSLTSITIPDGVSVIGESAFEGCSSLTTITIPESITSIGVWAFSNCSSLTSITIPDGVSVIGESVFYNCSSLTSITIPDGVTSIGDSAFCNCSSLTSITIPESVTLIEGSAFRNCSNLQRVNITNYEAWNAIQFGDFQANPLCNNGARLYLNGEDISETSIPFKYQMLGNWYTTGGTCKLSTDGITSITSEQFPFTIITYNDDYKEFEIEAIDDWSYGGPWIGYDEAEQRFSLEIVAIGFATADQKVIAYQMLGTYDSEKVFVPYTGTIYGYYDKATETINWEVPEDVTEQLYFAMVAFYADGSYMPIDDGYYGRYTDFWKIEDFGFTRTLNTNAANVSVSKSPRLTNDSEKLSVPKTELSIR